MARKRTNTSHAPRTALPNARVSPRFAGIPTFCRYPRLQDVAPDGQRVDWAIYGVPFDGGVTYRPGARFGPRAVRNESQYVKRYSIEHDVDICESLSLADAGDATVAPYSCEKSAELQFEFARSLGDATHTRLFAIGGDHSIALANMRATQERFCSAKRAVGKALAVIHFDSHLDTVDSVWDEQWGHASVFRRAIEAGIIDPKAMLTIGVKGPLNTHDDLEFARDHGVTVLTYDEFQARGPAAIRSFLKRIAKRPAYFSFDIDCIDPAFAPGTGTPSVGGFTSSEALRAVRAFKGANIVGADVVEVLPDRDVAGITALLAAHVMFEVLALDAATR